MQSWLIVALVVGLVLGLLAPLLYRRLSGAYRHWRAMREDDRVIARKVVTFASEAEMEAALRAFDRGDISGLLK